MINGPFRRSYSGGRRRWNPTPGCLRGRAGDTSEQLLGGRLGHHPRLGFLLGLGLDRPDRLSRRGRVGRPTVGAPHAREPTRLQWLAQCSFTVIGRRHGCVFSHRGRSCTAPGPSVRTVSRATFSLLVGQCSETVPSAIALPIRQPFQSVVLLPLERYVQFADRPRRQTNMSCSTAPFPSGAVKVRLGCSFGQSSRTFGDALVLPSGASRQNRRRRDGGARGFCSPRGIEIDSPGRL